MPRGQKKAEPKCDQHEFELKPCFQHMAHIQQLSLSFCSRHQEKRGKKGGEKGKCLQAPLYNTDNSWASPAFILETDKDYYRLRRDEMLLEHNMRFGAFSEQKSELNVPKPRSKHSFCNVCKQHYDDYLEHITSQTHKKKLKVSPFNHYIQELTQMIQREKQQKKIPVVSLDDSDEVQIISNPIKRIKTNETIEISPVEREMPCHPWQTFSGTIPQSLNFNWNLNFFMSPFGMVPMSLPPMNFQNSLPFMGLPNIGRTMEEFHQ